MSSLVFQDLSVTAMEMKHYFSNDNKVIHNRFCSMFTIVNEENEQTERYYMLTLSVSFTVTRHIIAG